MGKERDEESGFYYFGARFYAPWICRWVGADPSGTDDGTNPYCFVQCNPIRFIDIDGLFSWDPAAWGDALEAKITELEKSSLMEDKHVGTSLWNTLVATSATVAKGSTSILKVGTGAAQGVEDIKRGMREEGDAWDIAIGTARILSDAGEVAGAAAGAAGGVAKAGAAVKVATKARRASALRRQAQQMSKSSSQFRSTAEQIGELESDIAAAKAGLSEVKAIRRTTRRGTEARQGVDKAYRGSRNLNPFSKGPKP
jgi:RHS repeat-associated protein